ncbi:MAG: nuclear transport factor 2 family protein [Bacteroidales bacterium]|nr:nuclear transport factor 2 family protein [Bacteroidales bacterium]
MKRLSILILIFSMCVFVFAQDIEKEAIKKLVLTAYVDGLQNKGDLDATRAGFFPGFELLMFQNGMINKLPIYNWITYAEMKKAKEADPLPEEELTSCDFEFIDITGTAAVTKIHLSKGGKKIYTDYLSLYKFEDGWKIVSKIYYKLPE